MASGRCVELDYTLEQRAGLGEEPAILVAASQAVGLGGQPNLGLRELVQRAGISKNTVPGAFEVPMRETRIPAAASQDGRVDGILAEYQGLGALQQP